MKKFLALIVLFALILCSQVTALGEAFTNYKLEPGKSIVFTNTTTSNYRISIDGTFDYVVYDTDGSSYDKNQGEDSTKTFTIYKGMRTVITNTGSSSCNISGAAELFKFQPYENPAFKVVTLDKGQSVEYINNNKFIVKLSINGTFDYVNYDEDGSVYDKGQKQDATGVFTVYKAKRAVITNVSNGYITVAGPYELFTPTESSNASIKNYTLEAGCSKYIYNDTMYDFNISIEGKFDYVVYNEDGSVYDSARNYDATKVFKIYKDKKTVITNIGKTSYSISGPSELFLLVSYSDTAFYDQILKPNESLSFTNDKKFSVYLRVDGNFDYVKYDDDKSVYDSSMNQDATTVFKVDSGKRAIITNISNKNLTIGGASELFYPIKSQYPAFRKTIVKPGDSIEYTNDNRFNVTLSVSGMHDYVLYDKDNSVYDSAQGEQATRVFIVSGSKRAVITNSDRSEYSIYGAYELFNPIVSSSDPVTSIELNKYTLELTIGGKLETLNASTTPANLNGKKVIWKSSSPQIASVSESGTITPLKKGQTLITATIYNDSSSFVVSNPCTVSVVSAKQLESKETGNTKKEWIIRFSKPVDFNAFIKIYTVSIFDTTSNTELSCSLKAGNDSKSIRIIPPEAGYTAGHAYIITISGNGQKTQMTFKVKGNTAVSSTPIWVENGVSFVKDGQEIFRDEAGILYPRVSPDKKMLLYVNESEDELLIADFATQKVASIYTLPPEYTSDYVLVPCGWSGDSDRVLFTIFYQGGLALGGNKLMISDGTNVNQILKGVGHADWSTSGDIVYSFSSDMKIIDENGKVKQTVNTPDYSALFSADYPSFSPDGSKLVYNAGSDYFIHDLATNTYEKITDKDVYNSYPRINNNSEVIFDYKDSIYIYSPDKGKVELYYNKAKCSYPDWW